MAEPFDDSLALAPVEAALISAAGGLESLKKEVGELLRDCIDGVIKTPRTGRRLYDELQNSEKTYIGTCVEIDLRDRLRLSRGSELDLIIDGVEVDVKFSAGTFWMIPPEAFGQICIVISANETTGLCCCGLFLARPEYLTAGNRDRKCGISKYGRASIRWLFKDEPYPPNFWQSVPKEVAHRIANGKSGNERLMMLFREITDRPISRKVVEDVAAQRDFMRRVRSDGSRGTRNILSKEGIVVLSGTWAGAQELIRVLGLPHLAKSEFMSHRLKEGEIEIAKRIRCL